MMKSLLLTLLALLVASVVNVKAEDVNATAADDGGDGMEEGAGETGGTSGMTILDIVLNSPDHTSLAEAAALAGESITGPLSDEGSMLTLFAPTNDAFKAIAAATGVPVVDAGAEILQLALGYHAVAGVVMAEDLTTGSVETLVEGESLCVSVDEDGVMLNDQATVTTANIEASNGVVHVIDAVLLPNAILFQLSMPLVECGGGESTETETTPTETTPPEPAETPAPTEASAGSTLVRRGIQFVAGAVFAVSSIMLL